MYFIGISCGGESGAALFKGSELICASNEERFTRVKLDTSFPINSLKWCLDFSGITKEEISMIVYGFSSGCETIQNKKDFIEGLINIDKNTKEAEIIKSRIITETEIDQKHYENFLNNIYTFFQRDIRIERINHHFSHIAAAYIPSGMEKALVVTADGRGDYRSLTIGIASKTGFEELYCAPSWYSMGYFYGRMTKLCGFTPNRHEGKVTGLAAFGNPENAVEFVKKMIYVQNGEVKANLGDYYRPFFSNYSEVLENEAKKYSCEDLAAATQIYFENMFTDLIRYYIKKTGISNIALAGGVFSNISLNQAIYEIDDKIDVFVYPNMGDAGICVGGCYAWLWQNNKNKPKKTETMYLGYEIDSFIMADILSGNQYKIKKSESILNDIIEELSNGNTVGLVQGRAEFGPRALGNRSIIASPQNKNIISKINNQLGRDIFMPLAPIMPLELADEFIYLKNSNTFNKGFYMTMTFKAKPKLKELAPAVVHLDNTVRPQFVTKQTNGVLYDILMEWYKTTGCPALINTSFNSHEEPIINDEKDAVNAFERKVIDVLLFPPFIATRD